MKTDRHAIRKKRGAHFTPLALAEFLASRLIHHSDAVRGVQVRVLDPACGDGELLAAFASAAGRIAPSRLELVGVESDVATCHAARGRLAGCDTDSIEIFEGDFLELAAARRERPSLWGRTRIPPSLERPFDAVIANPPYVRTQIIGAKKAQQLAVAFGLKGRVDLYHPFLIAAAESLREGGLFGVITSNRFLCTQAGASVRGFLSMKFDVLEIIDLGDTKIFDAAVLPAILIGRKCASRGERAATAPSRFVKIYSRSGVTAGCRDKVMRRQSVFELLKSPANGAFQLSEGVFDVTVGKCQVVRGATRPWTMLAESDSKWLQLILRNSVGLLKDFAAVRVGIKTTADRVFIRSDWHALPASLRPEPELLHPILTHEDACRWRTDIGERPNFAVLYTHKVVNGKRRAIVLPQYPRARRYLESHRAALESRDYVIKAGRKWYEIWVPQDPDGWAAPKLVCPDISPESRFYLDRSGLMVDGDSYWITLLPDQPKELLFLILAVANSRLTATYHDLAFNNRLYSGRRRYLTQHVAHYPLPDQGRSECREVVRLVQSFLGEPHAEPERVAAFEATINDLVAAAFAAPTCSARETPPQSARRRQGIRDVIGVMGELTLDGALATPPALR